MFAILKLMRYSVGSQWGCCRSIYEMGWKWQNVQGGSVFSAV